MDEAGDEYDESESSSSEEEDKGESLLMGASFFDRENNRTKHEYKVTLRMQDGDVPVFGGAFNTVDKKYFNMFASVNRNRVTVYKCDNSDSIDLVQAYIDDMKEESFYTVTWARNMKNGHPLVVAGGILGNIRVIDCFLQKVTKTLVGHGNSVNEMRCHPHKPSLVLSASKDESVRLWNVETGVCVLILGGCSGHRNEVLSVDFHPTEKFLIASCGMDVSVRIWSIKDFWYLVEESCVWEKEPSEFPTQFVNYPLYVAEEIHSNYVDCVRWHGNTLLSKSVENEVVLWQWIPKPEDGPSSGIADILQVYPVKNCDIWFMRFSTDFYGKIMAVGNRDGVCFVWDIDSWPPPMATKLSHEKCKIPIRQTAVSHDGKIILCCCEDGSIWRWDRRKS